MPVAAKETTTFWEEIIEDVAVKVIEEPEFSAIVLALPAKLIEGAASSSVIVTVADYPMLGLSPPEIELIDTMIVSLTSDILSSIVVKLVVALVLPAGIVIELGIAL